MKHKAFRKYARPSPRQTKRESWLLCPVVARYVFLPKRPRGFTKWHLSHTVRVHPPPPSTRWRSELQVTEAPVVASGWRARSPRGTHSTSRSRASRAPAESRRRPGALWQWRDGRPRPRSVPLPTVGNVVEHNGRWFQVRRVRGSAV